MPTKATLSLHILRWTGERKCNGRLMGQDKDKETSLTNYHHGQNKFSLGKLVEFIASQIRGG